MSRALERQNRASAVGRLYKLKDCFGVPQLVVSTAAVFLHRFYMMHSFSSAPWDEVASIAFFLASKVEEQQRPLKYILAVTLSLNSNRTPHENPPNSHRYQCDESDPNLADLRKRMLFWEETMLKTLCFDLTVRHPNDVVLGTIDRCWKGARRREGEKLKNGAWNYIGDSLYTTLSLLHRPNVIAAAAVVCASVQLEIDLPTAPPPPVDAGTIEAAQRELGEEIEVEDYWLSMLNVAKEEVQDAVGVMMAAYDDATDNFVKAEGAMARPGAVELASKLELPKEPTPPPPTPAPAPEPVEAIIEPASDVTPAGPTPLDAAAVDDAAAECAVVPQKRGLEENEGQAGAREDEPAAVKVKLAGDVVAKQ